MAAEKTYLELSEEGGGSHKFYEVTVDGKTLTIRYGRIGDAGQTQVTKFPSPDKAKAEAEKKLKEKMKKGYEAAVQGVRQKRPITHRPTVSKASSAKPAPVLWKFQSGRAALGIYVDKDLCWVGNQAGNVYALDHDGKEVRSFKLPEGVKCLVADDVWRYAGSDDGKVYDLTGRAPRVAYEIAEHVSIFWLDIFSGLLAVSDSDGGVTVINHDDELQWNAKSDGSSGWMVRCDRQGVYHGHSDGVTAYGWDKGKKLWHQKTGGSVLFGWQEATTVYAGTSDDRVYEFTKEGKAGKVYKCDDTIYSCAASPDGKFVFAGDSSSSLYCFDEKGTRLWKLGTGCGSALSMQFFQGHLYIVTSDGSLACIDASETAIKAAEAGTVPVARTLAEPKLKPEEATAEVETTTSTAGGVVVECFKEGSKLHVRVVSDGFDSKWRVQFPRDIREEGARYVVEKVLPASQGHFYRAFGDIRKLRKKK